MQLFNNIQNEILNRIESSEFSIKIAVTWFTNKDLFQSLISKLNSSCFNADLIVLNDRINNKQEGCDFQKFIDTGGNFYFSSVDNMVHHKFCIIDDKIVITGSYNWTYYAENRNWENIYIIEEPKAVEGYINEFKKLTESHKKVDSIQNSKSDSISINFKDYLQTDYVYQAKQEILKGNDLNAAKVYTQILRINKNDIEAKKSKKEITEKYIQEEFEVSPFEIGVLFKNGYFKLIPAFEKLPFTISKIGRTVITNQKNIEIQIQKFDIMQRTILKIVLSDIFPSPEGTEKIDIVLKLSRNGILEVECNEIGGNEKRDSKSLNLKNWL